jgi:hypothetical protein
MDHLLQDYEAHKRSAPGPVMTTERRSTSVLGRLIRSFGRRSRPAPGASFPKRQRATLAQQGAVTKQQQKACIWRPQVDCDLFVAIDRMRSAILGGFCAFAAISSLCQHRHSCQPMLVAPPRYRSPPADAPPVSIVRPSWLGAWMGSRLPWRGIELSGRRRSRATAKRVAS